MRVTVRYWGQVEAAAGRSSDAVDVPDGATAGSVVAKLAAERGSPLRETLVDESGRPRATLMIVVGEEQVGADDPRELRNGDVVTLMPPISGG